MYDLLGLLTMMKLRLRLSWLFRELHLLQLMVVFGYLFDVVFLLDLWQLVLR